MAQQHQEIIELSSRDVAVLGASSDGANGGVHLSDEKDFKNMRLAIGTLDKTIFQISLSDDLADTRHIDIRLKRNSISGRQGQSEETAKGGDGAPPPSSAMAIMAGRDEEQPPELRHAAPLPQARLKITVAAEDDEVNDGNQEYLNEMRGWFLTVATLFVNMAFDAMLHPPDWMKTEWYEKGWFRTRHGDDHAAIITNPSHAAAAAVAPSPQPATASASQAFRAYFYLSSNSLTFALALALVLRCLDRHQKFSSWVTFITMNQMVTGVSLSLALTFAMGTSNNWKVTWIACVCLAVYTYFAFGYFVLNKRMSLQRLKRTKERKPRPTPNNQRRDDAARVPAPSATPVPAASV